MEFPIKWEKIRNLSLYVKMLHPIKTILTTVDKIPWSAWVSSCLAAELLRSSASGSLYLLWFSSQVVGALKLPGFLLKGGATAFRTVWQRTSQETLSKSSYPQTSKARLSFSYLTCPNKAGKLKQASLGEEQQLLWPEYIYLGPCSRISGENSCVFKNNTGYHIWVQVAVINLKEMFPLTPLPGTEEGKSLELHSPLFHQHPNAAAGCDCCQ